MTDITSATHFIISPSGRNLVAKGWSSSLRRSFWGLNQTPLRLWRFFSLYLLSGFPDASGRGERLIHPFCRWYKISPRWSWPFRRSHLHLRTLPLSVAPAAWWVDSLPRCLLAASGPSAASRCRRSFSTNAQKKRWRRDLRKVVKQFLRITENNVRAAEAVVPRIQFGLAWNKSMIRNTAGSIEIYNLV